MSDGAEPQQDATPPSPGSRSQPHSRQPSVSGIPASLTFRTRSSSLSLPRTPDGGWVEGRDLEDAPPLPVPSDKPEPAAVPPSGPQTPQRPPVPPARSYSAGRSPLRVRQSSRDPSGGSPAQPPLPPVPPAGARLDLGRPLPQLPAATAGSSSSSVGGGVSGRPSLDFAASLGGGAKGFAKDVTRLFMRTASKASSSFSLSSLTSSSGRIDADGSGGSSGIPAAAAAVSPEQPLVTNDAADTANSAPSVPLRAQVPRARQQQLVLPHAAFLSRVAATFRMRVPVATHTKDSLEYMDSFRGRDAVETLSQMLRTQDRNLALLLGRALDAQGLFHDVNYTHRLRDNPHELYQFAAAAGVAGSSGVGIVGENAGSDNVAAATVTVDHPTGIFTLLTECYSATCTRDRQCYSPSCPWRLERHYRSAAGARRGAGERSGSGGTRSGDSRATRGSSSGTSEMLWSTSVPPEILRAVSDDERRRQEVIFELVQTEREFVGDLQLVQRLFVKPLLGQDILESSRRTLFVRDVFANVRILSSINHRLLRRLVLRQREAPVVEGVGDIFVGIMQDFRAYIEYGTKQVYARYYVEVEKMKNGKFAQFLKDTERLPECRKLPIQSFLMRPTTRLGRYPLLLEQIFKRTPAGAADAAALTQAIAYIRQILARLNMEAGKADNFLKLTRLNQQLVWNAGAFHDLGLLDPSRQFLREGVLFMRKGGTSETEVRVFLLNNGLLLTKQKKDGYLKVLRRPLPLDLLVQVAGGAAASSWANAPIQGLAGAHGRASSSGGDSLRGSFSAAGGLPGAAGSASVAAAGESNSADSSMDVTSTGRYAFAVVHLGRFGGPLTLLASSASERAAWVEAVVAAKDAYDQTRLLFEPQLLADLRFEAMARSNAAAAVAHSGAAGARGDEAGPPNYASLTGTPAAAAAAAATGSLRESTAAFGAAAHRVHCSVFWSGHVLIGTESGVYVTPLADAPRRNQPPHVRRILDLPRVTQLAVFREAGQLVLLQTGAVLVLPLEAVDELLRPRAAGEPGETGREATLALAKRARRLVSHASFFRVGTSRGKAYLCTVRSAALTSTIKVFEPAGAPDGRRRSSGALGKLFRGHTDAVRLYKEFYIPTESTSLHFLKAKLCVGCTKGFEVIDLESLSTQGLLDPADPQLAFVLARDAVKPIAIFRTGNGQFFLCYNDFGFFVDRMGRRARSDLVVYWCGDPVAFAFVPPYLFAVEPSFVEIRHVDTGELCQVIPGSNFRCIDPDPARLHCVADHGDRQVLFRIAPAGGVASGAVGADSGVAAERDAPASDSGGGATPDVKPTAVAPPRKRNVRLSMGASRIINPVLANLVPAQQAATTATGPAAGSAVAADASPAVAGLAVLTGASLAEVSAASAAAHPHLVSPPPPPESPGRRLPPPLPKLAVEAVEEQRKLQRQLAESAAVLPLSPPHLLLVTERDHVNSPVASLHSPIGGLGGLGVSAGSHDSEDSEDSELVGSALAVPALLPVPSASPLSDTGASSLSGGVVVDTGLLLETSFASGVDPLDTSASRASGSELGLESPGAIAASPRATSPRAAIEASSDSASYDGDSVV